MSETTKAPDGKKKTGKARYKLKGEKPVQVNFSEEQYFRVAACAEADFNASMMRWCQKVVMAEVERREQLAKFNKMGK